MAGYKTGKFPTREELERFVIAEWKKRRLTLIEIGKQAGVSWQLVKLILKAWGVYETRRWGRRREHMLYMNQLSVTKRAKTLTRRCPPNALPLIKQLDSIMHKECLGAYKTISKRSGISSSTISKWRLHNIDPRLHQFRDLLQAIGYDLKIVQMEDQDV